MNRTNDSHYVDAREAARLLGVKRETLYAYVSRGLVRTTHAETGRNRRYNLHDLQRLRARSQARSGHGPVAAGALLWGEPVLDSSITSIEADGPHYRGRCAVTLARKGATLEEVAELLWQRPHAPWSHSIPRRAHAARKLLHAEARPIEAMMLGLALAGAADRQRFNLHLDAARAPALLVELAASLGSEVASRESLALIAVRGLGGRCTPATAAAMNLALVLCADHELNASAFAARVAASTGADLYGCLAAALGTLSGPRHGGATDRVEALLLDIATRGEKKVIEEHLRLGHIVSGFGHPLYPGGDPRAVPLLARARALRSNHPIVQAAHATARHMDRATGERPTLDLGLVALAAALGLAPGAAHAMFALGRVAGWIAHVFEQRGRTEILRPRARYVPASVSAPDPE